MTDSGIDKRVRTKAERGAFLSQLLSVSRETSADVHEDFVKQLSVLAKSIRRIFEGSQLIRQFQTTPAAYWKRMRGIPVAFIDGGVARIDLPSSAPMGIRVGAYSVKIGDASEAREDFSTALMLVDELYSSEAWTYDDGFDDTQKMTDAARIVGEASAALKLLNTNSTLQAVLLHGPLVNPVAPYGTPGFPSFSLQAARLLTGDKTREFTNGERHFILLYKEILRQLGETGRPVMGVVERSISKYPTVIFEHLTSLVVKEKVLSADDSQKLRDEILAYRLNDATLLSVLLETGEYLAPISVDRQQPSNKWPQQWHAFIGDYPAAVSTYIKCNAETDPFRVECLPSCSNVDRTLELVYQTARLLPNYGFPVGLDIVDKFAKVPNWMSQSVRQEHAIALLRKALASGDAAVIEYAKKALTARGRDWLFRPKA